MCSFYLARSYLDPKDPQPWTFIATGSFANPSHFDADLAIYFCVEDLEDLWISHRIRFRNISQNRYRTGIVFKDLCFALMLGLLNTNITKWLFCLTFKFFKVTVVYAYFVGQIKQYCRYGAALFCRVAGAGHFRLFRLRTNFGSCSYSYSLS